MAKIITQFASTMSLSQAAQVASLLKEGEDDGKYATEQAFKEDLVKLSSQLSSVNVPLFTFFEVLAGELVDNSRLNHEIRMMRLDMQTIFTELDALQDAVLGHQSFMENHITDVKNALAALDTNITTLELLADESDFNLAVVNTFNMFGAQGLSRSHEDAAGLYVDARKLESLGELFNLNINIHQEGLVLPIGEVIEAPIQEIELLEGNDSTSSDLQIDPDDNSVLNVLEENDGKYWVRSVLKLDEDPFSNPIQPPLSITASVRIGFGGFRTINTLTLVPFTDTRFDIDQILYLSTDGSWYNLLANEVTLVEKSILVFDGIETSELIFQLRQKSYTELVDFSYSDAPETSSVIHELVGQATAFNISLGEGLPVLYSRGYLFTVGFDFLGASFSKFREKGIYVSTPITTTNLVTELGLKSISTRSENSVGQPMDSIEFGVLKHNFNEADSLISSESFPVFPTSRIINKELLITDTSGIGSTLFFPELLTLNIYRDHQLLVAGTDFTLSVDGGLTYFTSVIGLMPEGPPIRLYIQFLNYLSSNSYTVSYTAAKTHPMLPEEPVWLDSLKTVFVDDQTIKFVSSSNTEPQSHSTIYLVILARSSNLLPTRDTPLIAEYSLLIREFDAI